MSFTPPLEMKTIIKSLPEFNLDIYAGIAPTELVVFAVRVLQEDGLPAATEEIISACFRLFPHRFSLKNYFYWPDSALIMRYLNEAKEKGDLKGKPADGFAVKVQGRQTVKRVAKILGVTLPTPEKKGKKSARVDRKAEPVKAKGKKQAEVKMPVGRKKPAVKKKAPPVKKINSRKVASKGQEKKKALKQKSQPRQLTLLPPPAGAKKTVQGTAARPKIKKEARPVKKEEKGRVAPIPASKEEKVKAGKVIHLMERSDAYRQYKKLDGKARISEFDFRNMLFATMESSSETLKRNVELFKRYANLHSRADLAAFLNFCEVSFAGLLKPSARKIGKRK